MPRGRLTLTHFRAVHRHLFQDVYRWAGRYRTVRISKGGSMFCFPENIRPQLQGLFGWLAGHNHLAGLDADDFAELGAHLLSELNAVHAFRESNGRAQMAFFAMLSDRAGHPLDLDRLEPEPFLAAMIAAFNGNEGDPSDQIRSLV